MLLIKRNFVLISEECGLGFIRINFLFPFMKTGAFAVEVGFECLPKEFGIAIAGNNCCVVWVEMPFTFMLRKKSERLNLWLTTAYIGIVGEIEDSYLIEKLLP